MFAAVNTGQTYRIATRLAASAALSIALLAAPGAATMKAHAQDTATQEKPSPDTIVAKVGGMPITERDLEFATGDLADQFAQVPETHRKAAVLNALIDIKALARQAEAEGLGETDAFKARMDFLRDRALHNAFFKEHALDAVSDEEVKARYDKEIAATPPREEIKASHILVKTEEEAKAIVAELDSGKDRKFISYSIRKMKSWNI